MQLRDGPSSTAPISGVRSSRRIGQRSDLSRSPLFGLLRCCLDELWRNQCEYVRKHDRVPFSSLRIGLYASRGGSWRSIPRSLGAQSRCRDGGRAPSDPPDSPDSGRQPIRRSADKDSPGVFPDSCMCLRRSLNRCERPHIVAQESRPNPGERY
jgi:hypothetical protein